MKIGVLFNCQGSGIAGALQVLLPGSTVVSHVMHHVFGNPRLQAAYLELYRGFDHVITIQNNRAAGLLATQCLRRELRRVHVLPPLNFRGFHPDMVYGTAPDGAHAPSPTGHYHSRIAVASFLAGYSAPDAVLLYNGLLFRRIGYYRVYEEDFAILALEFGRAGLDAAGMIGRLRQSGCFMHSMNHPKIAALGELARLVCCMIGEPAAAEALDGLQDQLSDAQTHPVFPEIAHALGVKPESAYRATLIQGQPTGEMTLSEFVHESFELYKTYDVRMLQSTDGVMDVAAAI